MFRSLSTPSSAPSDENSVAGTTSSFFVARPSCLLNVV